MTSPVLLADRIDVTIRSRRLLRDVSLAANGGEVIALVGPNGAGKSTLIRALAGDIAAASGRVLIDGRPVEQFRPHDLALRRAVLPQQTILQFAFTSREVVEMGRGPRRGHRDDETIVAASLAKSESTHLAERVYPSLSGGEQARVSLSRVLAQETPILLLDEPTASLDLRHQGLVMEVVRGLAADGAIVLAVLHDLNLAAAYADRIVILHDGRVAADSSPWQALTGPLLTEVFACPTSVVEHPARGCPLVLSLPSPASGAATATPLAS